LSALDFNLFAEDLEWASESRVYSCIAIEGDKTETTGTAGFFVHHQCRVDYAAKLLEEASEVFLGRFLTDTTNENLARSLLLLSRDGTLRINLPRVRES
jgi:hypothetical protein